MRTTRVFWLVLMLLLTICPVVRGGVVDKYNMVYLNMAAGLPGNFVDDIFEDSRGFIWICTQGGGLARYDGYGYRYMYAGGQGLSMRSNSCRNIAEDSAQRLWISFDECTEVIDLRTMRTLTPPTKTDTLAKQLESALKEPGLRNYVDTKGNLWVATQRHIYRMLMDSEGVITEIQSLAIAINTPDIALCDVDGDGSVWTYYDSRLWRVSAHKGKLRAVDLSAKYPQTTGLFVTHILPYSNKIWFASNEGLLCSDGRRWGLGSGLEHDFVNTLAISPSGSLLVGTLCGVTIMDVTRTGEIEQWNTCSEVNPLSSNFVNCILSKNGQVWVGTESGGIVKLIPRQLDLTNYYHQSGNASSLSQNAVNAMYVEPNGTLWVGTVEGGLNRKAVGSQDFTHYTTANSGLSHNSVSALVADRRGTLWIGTWAGGVNQMPLANPGQVTPLVVDEPYRRLLRFVGALAYDPINDGLWIGTNDGIYFYDFRKQRMEEPFAGCREIRGCIGSTITREGDLWMGCLEGVVRVNLMVRDEKTGRFTCQHYRNKLDQPQSVTIEKITAFCQAADGTLWLGSNGYGLYRMGQDKDGNTVFENITVNHGLVNNMVKGVVADKRGLLWITTNNGLSVYDPKANVFTNFSEEDGLACSQFYFNSTTISPQGVLYLGTAQGMTEVRGINKHEHGQGQLCFTRLTVDNQEINAENYLEQDISIAKRIDLHESCRSFTIEFSSLDYGPEKHGTYSYRMRGFEEEWTQLPPGEHSVRYTNLPTGDYEFEVRYTSGLSGDEQQVSVSVHVSPYFWKSWWFVSLALLACVALCSHLYRRRLDTMRRREVEKLYSPIEEALMESDDPDKLQLRIKGILDNQKLFRQSRDKTVEEEKKEVSKRMKPFMEVVMNTMERNYDKSEFGVTELAAAMNMGRSTLNKRIFAETGVSTNQFMRSYRLGVAKKMLEDKSVNRQVSEIAYRVGFNDPKYFTRCFTKEFGFSPSSYKV